MLLFLFIYFPKQISIYAQDTDSNDVLIESPSNFFLFEYVLSLKPENYNLLLDSIKNNLSEDYFSLRMAYTKTEDYSPYDIEERDLLKKSLSLIGKLEYDEGLSVLHSIQETNFVNISSHLYCEYVYKLIGDSVKSKYHYKIYKGLLNSIYKSGDGDTPQTAYIVISPKEEYNFLNWFDLKFIEQKWVKENGYSFDIMKFINKKTKKKSEIYFNISLAFNVLNELYNK